MLEVKVNHSGKLTLTWDSIVYMYLFDKLFVCVFSYKVA